MFLFMIKKYFFEIRGLSFIRNRASQFKFINLHYAIQIELVYFIIKNVNKNIKGAKKWAIFLFHLHRNCKVF